MQFITFDFISRDQGCGERQMARSTVTGGAGVEAGASPEPRLMRSFGRRGASRDGITASK
jgi:hypothetical protein